MNRNKFLIGVLILWAFFYFVSNRSPFTQEEQQECKRTTSSSFNVSTTSEVSIYSNSSFFMRDGIYEELYEETDYSKCISVPPSENMIEEFWNKMMVGVSLGSCPAQTPTFASLNGTFLKIFCNESFNPRYQIARTHHYKPIIRDYPTDRPEGLSIGIYQDWVIAICDLPFMGTKKNYFVQNIREEWGVERAKKYISNMTSPRALDINVAFFLIDDISRNQFMRSLTATTELLLKQAAQKYNVFDFKRYNVVGPNSLPNQSPMFLGRLVNYSRPDYDNYKQLHSSRPTDDWLWSYYGERGYVTMYGVESCSPPFAVARPVHLFSRNFYCPPREGGADGAGHDTFDRGKIPCLGQRYVQEYVMDYLSQFYRNYEDVRTFVVTNWMTNHEQTLHRGRTLDIPMKEFLKKLDKQGVLNKTILFVASDHGSHSDFLLKMLEGRIEHRNPPLYAVIPKWICAKYPELCKALEHNTEHLISAHDIYATLKHIPIYPNPLNTTGLYGQSLLEKIEHPRSCKDANVPKEFCQCFGKKR